MRWERDGGGEPGRIRVTPQLIAVKDDSHLWSQVYEAELSEVFAVQTADRGAGDGGAGRGAAGAGAGGARRRAAPAIPRPTTSISAASSTSTAATRRAISARRPISSPRRCRSIPRSRWPGAAGRAHTQVYWHYYDHTDARLALAAQGARRRGRARARPGGDPHRARVLSLLGRDGLRRARCGSSRPRSGSSRATPSCSRRSATSSGGRGSGRNRPRGSSRGCGTTRARACATSRWATTTSRCTCIPRPSTISTAPSRSRPTGPIPTSTRRGCT